MCGHTPGEPEVPFADMYRVIALIDEQLGNGYLGGGHTHVLVAFYRDLGVDDDFPQSIWPCLSEPGELHHTGRCGGEFETEASAVASGHQRGARGCAGAICRIAIAKRHALPRD